MADFHQYGTASQAKLDSCHPDLERVFKRALRMTPDAIDITIVWGWRSQAEQNAIDPRFTNARWPSSYHNATDEDDLPLSDAVDFAPYITLRNGKKGIPWSDNNLFCLVAGIILAAASIENVAITWGGDFDRDGSTEDQSLADLGHCQRTHAARRPRTILT